MSEFEIASLDHRAATLAARHWANWIAGAALAVSAVVGAAQCAIVAWGIREMARANRDGMRRTEARTRAADRRHAEDMRRLDALIERQAERRRALDALIERQAERRRALDALIEEQAERRRASDAQTRALEALLERAAAKPPAA